MSYKIRRVWNAFLKLFTIKDGIFAATILALPIVGLYYLLLPPPPRETEAQQRYRLARDAQYAAESAAASKQLTEERLQIATLCRAKSLCADYAEVRQTCASAGSYKNCMEIKLGRDKFLDAGQMCTEEGQVNFPPDQLPWWPQCLKAGWGL
jgi:hypothetical protein